MHKSLIRLRQVVTASALTGVVACCAFAPVAAADTTPDWMVTAAATGRGPVVVRGLSVRPDRDRYVLPVAGYRLTAAFGSAGGLWSSGHTGLDFAAPEGTPLRAIGSGVITQVGYDGAYGYKTVLRLEDGTELWYCHQSRQAVAVGDRVAAGDVVGTLGSTGNVTGPHLHLEVRVGREPVDPQVALEDWGIRP